MVTGPYLLRCAAGRRTSSRTEERRVATAPHSAGTGDATSTITGLDPPNSNASNYGPGGGDFDVNVVAAASAATDDAVDMVTWTVTISEMPRLGLDTVQVAVPSATGVVSTSFLSALSATVMMAASDETTSASAGGLTGPTSSFHATGVWATWSSVHENVPGI